VVPYAYDFGDTAHLTPLTKMHTLGSTFTPPGFHAGGLRYHGMAPLVSHVKELGLIEARAYHQIGCFEAGVTVRPRRGHPAGAGSQPRGASGAIDEALRCKEEGDQSGDSVQPVRPRPFRHAGLYGLFRRQTDRSETTTKPNWRWRCPACRR
jgi:predicted alternative tryptophan synthase beta-subunit